MIEKVARAIIKARFYDPEPDAYGHSLKHFFDSVYPQHGEDAEAEARAAIEAMLEPSIAMVDSGVAFALNVTLSGDYTWSRYVADKHARMIRAALEAEGGRDG